MGPGLSGRADDIGAVLSAKPGVEDVETQYQNGFDSGRSITYIIKIFKCSLGAISIIKFHIICFFYHASGMVEYSICFGL